MSTLSLPESICRDLEQHLHTAKPTGLCLEIGNQLMFHLLPLLSSSELLPVLLSECSNFDKLPLWLDHCLVCDQPLCAFAQEFKETQVDGKIDLLLWDFSPDQSSSCLSLSLAILESILAPSCGLLIRYKGEVPSSQFVFSHPWQTVIQVQEWWFLKYISDSAAREAPSVGCVIQEVAAYRREGHELQAEELLLKALQKGCIDSELLKELADIVVKRGDLATADWIYSQVISLNADDIQALSSRATLLKELNRLAEAGELLEHAINLDSSVPELHCNLGTVLQQAGLPELALASFQTALELRQDFADAYSGRGRCLCDLQKVPQAIEAYELAIKYSPDNALIYNAYGNALRLSSRLQDALTAFNHSLDLDSCLHKALNNRANVLHELGCMQEASADYRKALELDPTHPVYRYNFAAHLLLTGDWQTGFELYECRFEAFSGLRQLRDCFPGRRWQGEDLGSQSLLVWNEQGLGDQLQFCRMLGILRKRYPEAKIYYRTYSSLIRLLTQFADRHQIHLLSDTHELPEYDSQIPIFSLFLLLGVRSVEDLPNNSYLYAKQPRQLPEDGHTHLHVGIVWCSGSREERDLAYVYRIKSVNINDLIASTLLEGVSVYSLQVGQDEQDILKFVDNQRIFSLGEQIHDFQDTADFLASLDLLVTVDTSIAHLAGAMGMPVWVLLPAVPDWRWGLQGTTTPWYPSMRLYRQEQQGDWSKPLAAIRRDLTALVVERSVVGSSLR